MNNVARKPRVDGKRNRQGIRTRVKLLKAAERLFGDHGFHAVSMRDITKEAGVDLALANYHFGTKKGLFHQALKRRADDISRRREEALVAIEEKIAPGEAGVKAVIAAFIDPLFHRLLSPNPGWRHYARLIAQVAVDDHHADTVREILDPTAKRFLAALQRVLPSANPASLEWGFMFSLGALAQMHSQTHRLEVLSNTGARAADLSTAQIELRRYLENALLAYR